MEVMRRLKGSSVDANGRRRHLLADPYHGSLCRAKQTGSASTTNSAKISGVRGEPPQERLVCAPPVPPPPARTLISRLTGGSAVKLNQGGRRWGRAKTEIIRRVKARLCRHAKPSAVIGKNGRNSFKSPRTRPDHLGSTSAGGRSVLVCVRQTPDSGISAVWYY